jgi:hypothetical protein
LEEKKDKIKQQQEINKIEREKKKKDLEYKKKTEEELKCKVIEDKIVTKEMTVLEVKRQRQKEIEIRK